MGLLKFPMIAYVGPIVEELTEQKCEVIIPFNYRNANRLIGGIYFGSLCVGADLAGGLMAYEILQRSGKQFSLAFKDFKAEFFKRAEGDAHFICKEGAVIKAMVDEALKTKERVNQTVHVEAYVPSKQSSDPVAKFALTLSIKAKD